MRVIAVDRFSLAATMLCLVPLLLACGVEAPETAPEAAEVDAADPWALPPPPPPYSGPLFKLAHDYPNTAVHPPSPTPWDKAVDGGYINPGNAEEYVLQVKKYIAEDMRVLLYDNANWDGDERGWYNQPWLGSIRDPLKGTYVGSEFPPAMFPLSGLTEEISTHVLVYYDDVSAASLQAIWGESGMDPIPALNNGLEQFPEGGIIVKAAFTTLSDASAWPPIKGAYPWEIYGDVDQKCTTLKGAAQKACEKALVFQEIYFFQFDLIVKDSSASPHSQWVFATLVYDKDAPGDNWDKMVPLGAMWGNDPDVNSPQGCDYLTPGGCPELSETWINQTTPVYARETLGWGGRLSGPNDGAVDLSPPVRASDGTISHYDGRYAMSSCMSCHSVAEYEQESFLLPAKSDCSGDSCKPSSPFAYWETGNTEWTTWFQDRPGHKPKNEPQIALDYDMNYSFKVLPTWYSDTGQGTPNFADQRKHYRGLPRGLPREGG